VQYKIRKAVTTVFSHLISIAFDTVDCKVTRKML